jgi:hypothetical protein
MLPLHFASYDHVLGLEACARSSANTVLRRLLFTLRLKIAFCEAKVLRPAPQVFKRCTGQPCLITLKSDEFSHLRRSVLQTPRRFAIRRCPKTCRVKACPKPSSIWNAQHVSVACPQSESQLAKKELRAPWVGATLARSLLAGVSTSKVVRER